MKKLIFILFFCSSSMSLFSNDLEKVISQDEESIEILRQQLGEARKENERLLKLVKALKEEKNPTTTTNSETESSSEEEEDEKYNLEIIEAHLEKENK